jgi:hypothetical protein
MTIWIPIEAVRYLTTLQDVTAVITTKPAKPEYWIRVELNEDALRVLVRPSETR